MLLVLAATLVTLTFTGLGDILYHYLRYTWMHWTKWYVSASECFQNMMRESGGMQRLVLRVILSRKSSWTIGPFEIYLLCPSL